MSEVMTLSKKYVGREVLLDGKPAFIRGSLRQFALIAPLDPKIGMVEFAWKTVDFIMREREGKFYS